MTTPPQPLDPLWALLSAENRGLRLRRPKDKLDQRSPLLALVAPGWSARAQGPPLPAHACSLMLPFGLGGIADLSARAVAQALSVPGCRRSQAACCVHALARPAVLRQLRALGVRPQGGTPEQLQQWLAAEIRHGAERVRGPKIEPL